MEVLKVLDIRKLDKQRIDAKVSELRKQLFDLKMKKATSGLEKPHQLSVIKQSIARLSTVRNQIDRGAK